jgi:nucleotide-binding universal stress UspA family protein
METLLVPTDFSPTAKNAALYALQLAEQLAAKKIVLYHSYEIPVTIDPMVPGIQMLDMESLKESSEKNLEIFKGELLALANGIAIDTISEYGALTQGLDEVCAKVNAGLVVMGITGGGVLEEKLIGSNTLSVAKHTKLPVIIVPADSRFTRIEEIMLTSDFDKADKAIPVDLVRKILAETKAKLFVFNIEEDDVIEKYPSTIMGESYAIHSLLQDMNPEYHYSTNTNYVEAVNDFAVEYQIDLIISIPKKHGFFERLFSSSHTKQLAFHSHVPLMVIHQ